MRPVELVRRADAARRRPRPATSIGPCGPKCTASTHASAPASCASAATSATGVTVPTAFDAHGNATTRVRSDSSERRWSRSEPALVVDLGEPHDQALVVRELEPRRDVAVVVELRADHLVARDPLARRRAREREVQRRHVLAERHLVGGRVEEAPPRLPARRSEQRVRVARRSESRRRGSRSSRAGSRRSRRSPSPEPACRPARRRTRGAAGAPRIARGRPRSWSCPSPSREVPVVVGTIVSDAPTKQSRSAFTSRS